MKLTKEQKESMKKEIINQHASFLFLSRQAMIFGANTAKELQMFGKTSGLNQKSGYIGESKELLALIDLIPEGD